MGSSNDDVLQEIGERLAEPSLTEICEEMSTEELKILRDGIGEDDRIIDPEAREIYREARKRAIEGGEDNGFDE
jgi:hypothetical protein